MLFKTFENERRLWVQYAVVLLLVGVCIASVTTIILLDYSTTVRENVLEKGSKANDEEAESISKFLQKGEMFVSSTSRMLEVLLSLGASHDQIESLLVVESDDFKRQEKSGYSNLLGVINGDFYNDGRWMPIVGYVPSRRPWYQEAFKARGQIALIPTHMNYKGNEQVVSIARRLSDKKSVLALDISLKSITDCMTRRQPSDIWMILDKEKDAYVIAHPNPSRVGRKYRSADFWGSDEEKLVSEVLMANGAPVSFAYEGRDYSVFSSLVEDRWYVVKMVEKRILWHDLQNVVLKNVILAILLYLFLVGFITYSFVGRLRNLRAHHAKTSFLSNMSREIRTSVTGMLGMNTIVMNELRSGSLKDYLKSIQSVGQGVLSLVDDVLDVTRIESGKLGLVSMEYDVMSVLTDCYNLNLPKAVAKNLKFSIDCNPDIPSSLWGDEKRIRQIINNLLSNAIKFTEIGEVVLSVNFEHLPPIGVLKADDYIMLNISISDTGVGIRQDRFESIFRKYIPEKGASEESQDGTGLGLSLTKELVEKCGGQIKVDSHLGEGSIFEVRLPQLVLNIEPMGEFFAKYKNAMRRKGTETDFFFAPEAKILIVDDVEMNLKVFRGFLKGSKAQIDVALSGSQCLKLAQSKHYDLIFLDHMMPVMDGIETYKRMRSIDESPNRTTPVIVLTSESYAESKDSFLTVGFTDYLPKPVKEKDLLRAMKWYLPKQLVLTFEDLLNSNEVAAVNALEQGTGDIDDSEVVELRQVTPRPQESLKSLSQVLNVEYGLSYCADDEEIYIEMLQEYVTSPLCRTVDNCCKNEDWNNYLFYIHVLSDVSTAIGAENMAERFHGLEEACRESRIEFVMENHPLVMALHADLVQEIQKGLEER